MKKLMNRAFAAILSLMMVVSVISFMPVKAEGTTKTAYVTIEKFTIGQGYVMQPTKVEFTEGDTVTDVVNKAAAAESVELVYTDSGYGSYLSAIKNADSGAVNIPNAISALGDFESYGMKYPAPTNENIRANTNTDGLLSEFTFTDMSGWMYSVNNMGLSESASVAKVQDGDVIRVQFSIYGWGLDLGNADFDTGKTVINLANKDKLIKLVAEIKADPTTLEKGAEDTFDIAVGTLESYDVTQANVDQAYENLKKVSSVVIEEATTEITTKEEVTAPKEEVTVPKEDATAPKEDVTVATAKVKKGYKAAKSAKSVKVTIKKLKDVNGYQVKIHKTKADAKADKKVLATKKTKKNVSVIKVINKNLKNKKKVFVKVCAYKIVDKKIYFGNWSKIVKVTVKK